MRTIPEPRTLRVALVTLGDPGTLTGGYLYHRRMAALAPRHAARVAFVSFPERPFPLAVLDAPRVMRRVARLRPHALVLDSIAAAFVGPWPALGAGHIPVVAMLHQPPGGIDYGPFRTRVQAALDRLAYRRARLLMVASESLFDELSAGGIPPGKMRVVPPGRDVAVLPPGALSRRELRHGRRAAFLCVGNWVERKGIHDLLDAFAYLPEGLATLHLAGNDNVDPSYSARIRARLSQPDLLNRVVVHGPLPVEEVAALYASADAFVLPSMKEPYGTVYGEAMAYGLPVVGWRAGNLPYLARDEQDGLLVDPGDVEGLAEAMRRLAADPALRERLGESARQRALSRPTWDESATLFFGFVREAVSQAVAPRTPWSAIRR